MDFRIVPIEGGFVKDGFDCGSLELNRYLFSQSSQDVRKYYATLFVAVENIENRVIGYYTLSNTSIELNHVPVNLRRKLPKYKDVPAIRLGRLAVDVKAQGYGVGSQLLADAVIRSVLNVSAWAIMAVDAKDDKACSFYKKYGFTPLTDDERHLYISRQDLEKCFLRVR